MLVALAPGMTCFGSGARHREVGRYPALPDLGPSAWRRRVRALVLERRSPHRLSWVTGPVRTADNDALYLVPADWWTVAWYKGHPKAEFYVNICTPQSSSVTASSRSTRTWTSLDGSMAPSRS